VPWPSHVKQDPGQGRGAGTSLGTGARSASAGLTAALGYLAGSSSMLMQTVLEVVLRRRRSVTNINKSHLAVDN